MKDKQQDSATPAAEAMLRQRAEAQVRAMEPTDVSDQAPEAIERMLHELRVHQIELEMQNEELRTAQSEIEASRARYFELYDLAPVGYFNLSEKGRILEANLTAAALLGVPRSALVNQPISRFIFKEDQDIYYLHRKKSVEVHSTGSGQADDPGECELRMVRPDGTFIWTHLTENLARSESGASVFRVVLSDITERKQVEAMGLAKAQADEANKAKSEFLANMSHEIRTPMNGVLGFAELLQNTPLNETQKVYVDYIRTSGKGLLHIINDILDLSKIEAEKMDLEMIKTDIVELIEQTANMISYSVRKKGIEWRLNIDPGIPRFAMVDPVRLRQILLNLLNNALKFTEKGKITLKAALLKREGRRGCIQFSVCDTGIGISEAQKGKLFKAFSQGDGSTTRKYGGTGLGLVISDRLAQLMGGTLAFESAPGEGTEFTFSIETDIEECVETRVAAEREKTAGKIVISQACLILVADDDSLNRLLATEIIRILVPLAEFIEAGNGSDAFEQIVKCRPDLVFMDVQMPEMDGKEATARLRKHEDCEKTARTVVVGLTAGAHKHEREHALASGMDDYLTKPIGIDALAAVLEKWMPGARQPPQVGRATLPDR